jgi:co-chaperonin GroES (HSP10)
MHNENDLDAKNEPKRRGWPKGKPRKVNGVIHTKKNEVASEDSGIVPFEFKVLVKQDVMAEKTKGGIIIPDAPLDDQRRAVMKGVIVSMSTAAFSYHNWGKNTRLPQVGDRVVYSRYAGSLIEGKDEVEYRLINDKDIGAIIDF